MSRDETVADGDRVAGELLVQVDEVLAGELISLTLAGLTGAVSSAELVIDPEQEPISSVKAAEIQADDRLGVSLDRMTSSKPAEASGFWEQVLLVDLHPAQAAAI